MKEKKTFHIGTGITSLLMIFVVLCLTTFGILSYSSANAEYALTKKNSNYVTNYYDAYSKGAKILAKIDKIIYEERHTENLETAEYFDSIKGNIEKLQLDEACVEVTVEEEVMYVTYIDEISRNQDLKLEIMINKETDTKRYKVISCYVNSEIGNMSYEEELPDMWGE